MPSSVMLDWSARAPLTAPLRGSMLSTAPVRLSLTWALGTYTAPGCRLSRPLTLLASSGSARICVPEMTLPRLASVTLMREISPVTLIVSVSVPMASCMSKRAVTSTASGSFSRTAVRNPDNSARTSYNPGGNASSW